MIKQMIIVVAFSLTVLGQIRIGMFSPILIKRVFRGNLWSIFLLNFLRSVRFSNVNLRLTYAVEIKALHL